MSFAFDEVSIVGDRPVPEEYKDILKAVSAANEPPHVRSAQTYYLFQVEDGTIIKAWTGDSPVQTLFDFLNAAGWTYAVIPHSILQSGTVLSYSVIHKQKEPPCRESWLSRLRTSLRLH